MSNMGSEAGSIEEPRTSHCARKRLRAKWALALPRLGPTWVYHCAQLNPTARCSGRRPCSSPGRPLADSA